MAPSRTALFVYGTLKSEARLLALTGRRFPRRPARLAGWACLRPRGGYPYVVPRRGARVNGILLEDIDPASLRALDAYEEEGRLYRRQPLVVMAGGRRVPCEAYVGARPPSPPVPARGRRPRRASDA